MEQFLDSRTLAFISGSILVVLCFIMLTEYLFHKVYPGFTNWIIANFLLGTALFLLCMRGLLPDVISIIAANAMIVLFCQLITSGLARFFGLIISRRLDMVVDAVYLSSFIYFTYLAPNLVARVIVISVILTLYALRCTWLIRRGSRLVRFSVSRMLIWTFYLMASWFGLRAFLYAIGDRTIKDMASAGPIDGLTYTIGICTYIFIATGLIQLNTSRIERELLDAQEEIRTIKGFLPICTYCKNVRDDDGYWNQLEAYISSRTDAKFSHGICPKCMEEHFPEYYNGDEEQTQPG